MKQLFLIFLSVIFCSSCLDQVNKYYPDYNSIVLDDYQNKGWIPDSLLPPSTSKLHSRTNLDVNSFMICYQVNTYDLELIKGHLKVSNQEFVKPHGINLPKWWFKDLNLLETYKLKGDSTLSTFAIDANNNTIYYWGNLIDFK